MIEPSFYYPIVHLVGTYLGIEIWQISGQFSMHDQSKYTYHLVILNEAKIKFVCQSWLAFSLRSSKWFGLVLFFFLLRRKKVSLLGGNN